jgi:hypothetical protein
MNSNEAAGTVRALWKFPVKPMQGENVDVTRTIPKDDGVSLA